MNQMCQCVTRVIEPLDTGLDGKDVSLGWYMAKKSVRQNFLFQFFFGDAIELIYFLFQESQMWTFRDS